LGDVLSLNGKERAKWRGGPFGADEEYKFKRKGRGGGGGMGSFEKKNKGGKRKNGRREI